MESLALLLFCIFFIGIITSIVCLVICFIKKDFKFTKKQMLLSLLICFIGFIGSVIFFGEVQSPESKAKYEQQQKDKKEAKEQEKKAETNQNSQDETATNDKEEIKSEDATSLKDEDSELSQSEDKDSSENQDISENENISTDKIKEYIEPGIGKEDQILNIKLENKTLVVDINLGTTSFPIPTRDLAISRFSSISDNLLEYDFWYTLTVNFENVGGITMNFDEASSNEYGKYFDSRLIDKRLK